MNIRYPIYEGVYRILTPLLLFSNETVANILKVPDILEQEKENPTLSHDKTGLKTIRNEKISQFSHGLTCVRPWHGNNIYRPA